MISRDISEAAARRAEIPPPHPSRPLAAVASGRARHFASVHYPILAGMAALVFWCAAARFACAAPPDVTSIFPAGGQRGQEVKLKLQGKFAKGSLQLFTTSAHLTRAANDDKESITIKIAEDAVPGLHWLAFYNLEGVSRLRSFLVGTVPELSETEPNNSLAQAPVLDTLPVTINGVLEKSGDVDTCAVDLPSGGTCVAILDALHSLGSPMDGVLQVTDERGFVLLQNDDAQNFDPQLAFTAPRAGRYYIRLFAFPAKPDSTIRYSGSADYVYRLTLTTGPCLTRVQPPAVTAGQSTSVTGFGWNVPAGGQSVELPALEPGLSPLIVEGIPALPCVEVTPFPVVAAVSGKADSAPQEVTIPICATGVISSPKSQQAWSVSGKKGERISLRVMTGSIGSPLDALLRILDPQGKRLKEVDDARRDACEIAADFTFPADGTYVVQVSDRFGRGGPEYVYALTMAPLQPDFALRLTASTFTVKPKSKLDIEVTVDRYDGFSEPLTIRLEDLPEGVVSQPVTSEPKGDSAKKVKLVLESTQVESWIGQVRIVGEGGGAAPLRRVAAAAREDALPIATPVVLYALPEKQLKKD